MPLRIAPLALAAILTIALPVASPATADEKGIDRVVPKRAPAKRPAIRRRAHPPAKGSTPRGPSLTADARRLYRAAEAARRSNASYRYYGRWCRNKFWMVFGPGRMCKGGPCEPAVYKIRSDSFILQRGRPGAAFASFTRYHFRSANMIEQTGFRHICKTCRGWGNFTNRKLYWKRC